MSEDITIRYIWSRPADDPTDHRLGPGSRPQHEFGPKDDPTFAFEWPNRKTEETFRPRIGDGVDLFGSFQTTITAVLTSTAFASIIIAWLKSRRRKIVIKDLETQKSIEYEGPNPSDDLKAVATSIEELSKGVEKPFLQIYVFVAEDEHTKVE